MSAIPRTPLQPVPESVATVSLHFIFYKKIFLILLHVLLCTRICFVLEIYLKLKLFYLKLNKLQIFLLTKNVFFQMIHKLSESSLNPERRLFPLTHVRFDQKII